jgi:hypothetical protein
MNDNYKEPGTGLVAWIVFAVATVVTLLVIAGLGVIRATAATTPPVLRGAIGTATTHSCKFDEAVSNCHWNARTQGDGLGHSFYSSRVGNTFCVTYWDKTYNRKHGQCLEPARGRVTPEVLDG